MNLTNTINCPHCQHSKIIISIEALCAGDKFCCQLCNTVISLAAEDRMQVKSASEKLQSSSAIGNCNSDYAKFS
ncbi:hypothetical protein I6F65_10830 [Pseudoalteromonas sp. SWXJZ94C]|uniref:hypothetical protein n=1 Tax=unclassified Pseudoalteromonas TaxID=194690 RepID=UPI000464AF9C|nr:MULTISPECIES: hypothetical protein [unclassified Pseudoalteromonas]MBH0057456.1 hypothetical protein [Pseudoalteromonas sp. SWXJZ94C]